MTKVSVIIPCYNYGNYIEQCLMSVVLQNRDFNIEILVGDDKSSDNSFEIAKR
jgi:glycosyltransferase involved in cell wall biosynthesis